MPLIPPPGIPADGSWRVWFVLAMANTAVPSLATDINATSTVDASCLLTKSGVGLDVAVDKYKDERLCTVQVFEQNGVVTYSVSDLEYVYDPQTPASATNKLYAALGSGGNAFMVIRPGMPAETAPLAAQKVWVVPVSLGPSVPLPPEANSMSRVKQPVSVTGTVQRDVAIAA